MNCFFVPKFFEWVNTIIPNKFPSLVGDHPRLVIPFFDENNKLFCFQGRSFGNEQPKYITFKLDPDRNKIYGLNRVDKSKTYYVVEGSIDSLFLDNCLKLLQMVRLILRKIYQKKTQRLFLIMKEETKRF